MYYLSIYLPIYLSPAAFPLSPGATPLLDLPNGSFPLEPCLIRAAATQTPVRFHDPYVWGGSFPDAGDSAGTPQVCRCWRAIDHDISSPHASM